MRPVHVALEWLVEEWRWPYAGAFAAALLLPLFPILWSSAGLAVALVFLQLPVYMIHQLEEHGRERFRLYINGLFGGTGDVLTRAQIFWINALAVWALFLASLLLARYVDLALGLVSIYVTGLNALTHVIAGLAKRSYNPGLYTAIALMLPASVWGAIEVNRVATPGLGYELLAVVVAIGLHVALIGLALRGASRVRLAAKTHEVPRQA